MNEMITKKNILMAMLVGICAATMATRGAKANMLTRALVAFVGGTLVGVLIVLWRPKSHPKAK